MKELEKYVTLRESKTDDMSIIYIDVNHTTGAHALTKKVKMAQTDKSKLKELLVKKIIELANYPNDLPELSLVEDWKKSLTKIVQGGSFIAINGRIGPATNMLISEANYNKYHIEKIAPELKLEVLLDDSVDDLILYRKNSSDQPGLILAHTENEYEFVEIGFFPNKQFFKIKL